MRYFATRLIWLLVAMLIIFHQDSWNWDSSRLVMGLPIGLSYHIGLSLVASLVWLLACFIAWPREVAPSTPEDEGGKR